MSMVVYIHVHICMYTLCEYVHTHMNLKHVYTYANALIGGNIRLSIYMSYIHTWLDIYMHTHAYTTMVRNTLGIRATS